MSKKLIYTSQAMAKVNEPKTLLKISSGLPKESSLALNESSLAWHSLFAALIKREQSEIF